MPLRSVARASEHWTVSRRLALMVAGLIVPVSLLLTATIAYLAVAIRDAQDNNLLYSARALAAAVDARLSRYTVLARALASSPALLEDNLSPFEAEARRAFTDPEKAWVVVADLDGNQLMNLVAAPQGMLPKRSPAALSTQQRAMSAGGAVVSDAFVGAVFNDWIATIELPVLKDGRPFRHLAVIMDLRSFVQLLVSQQLPQGWLAAIVDGQGRLIARAPDHERYVGRLAPESLRRELAREQVIEGISLDGAAIVAAAVPTASGWGVRIAVNRSEIYAPVWRAVRWSSLIGIGIVLGSLLLAFWIARGISEPILELGRIAPSVLRGREMGLVSSLPEVTAVGALLHQASERLRKEEEQLRQALDASAAGVWSWSALTNETAWDDRHHAQYGFAPEEPRSSAAWMGRVHPDDRERIKARIRAVLASPADAVWHEELRALHPTLGQRWMLSMGRVERDASGMVLGMSGINIDITDRRRAEEALRRSEERNVFLLRLSDALRPLQSETELVSTASTLLGEHLGADRVHYAEHDAAAGALTVPPDYCRPDLTSLAGRHRLGDLFETIPALRAGGTLAIADSERAPLLSEPARAACRRLGIRALISAPLVQKEELARTLSVASRTPREWTPDEVALVKEVGERTWVAVERARAEAALRNSEEQFRVTFEASCVGMVQAQPMTLELLRVNRRFCDMTGYDEDELIGKPFSVITHPEDCEADALGMARLLRSEIHEYRGEKRYLRKDGSILWAEVSVNLVRDAAGLATRTIAVIQDVTDRMRARETRQRLQQSQKLEAVGQLSGGIAHDMNNMLTVVSGNLDLALPRIDDGRARQFIQNALDAVERGASFNRRLLSFARQRKLEPVMLDLNQRVTETGGLLRQTIGEQIRVSMRLAADLWPTRVDPGEIDNVLLNLAINARDAMPSGGSLTIETSNTTLDAQSAARHPDARPGDFVQLCVSDTGHGMNPEVLRRAMEPFFTTKEPGKGTGLGLSSIYGFVRQSGGFLWIESEEGSGTTARVCLPRAAAEPARGAARRAKDDVPVGDGELILVVEDDDQVRQVTLRRLEALGYAVAEARSGPEAISVLKTEVPVALVFTDVVMPGGMTGYDVVRWCRSARPGLKVLLTSGYNQPIREDTEALGGLKILGKPYSRAQLGNAIREALAG